MVQATGILTLLTIHGDQLGGNISYPQVVLKASDLLGHSQVGITLDVYSHVLPGLQRTTAHAFDRLFAADDRAS